MKNSPTSLLGGLPIAQTDMRTSARGFVAEALERRGSARRPFYSTSANGQVLALCGKDPEFVKLMLKADQIHADGMPMVLYSRLFSSAPLPERVATTDLVHEVARLAEQEGLSFYFLGASEEVNAKAVEQMRKAYPRLNFVGRRNGYFARSEEAGIIEAINAAKPDILWIGLGVPLEQQFIDRNIDLLTGVGAVKTSAGLFDFVSGQNYLTTNPKAIRALIRHSA